MYTCAQLNGVDCVVCGDASAYPMAVVGAFDGSVVIACEVVHGPAEILAILRDLEALAVLEAWYRLPSPR